jgi:hypothetical protein
MRTTLSGTRMVGVRRRAALLRRIARRHLALAADETEGCRSSQGDR